MKEAIVVRFAAVTLVATVLLTVLASLLPATAYVSAEAFQNLWANNIITAAALVLGALVLPLSPPALRRDSALGLGLFSLYNTIPLLVELVHVPALILGWVAAVAQVALVGALLADALRGLAPTVGHYRTSDRVLATVPTGLFGLVFIARALSLIAPSLGQGLWPPETVVALADLVVCTLWCVVALAFLLRLPLGNGAILGVLLQSTTLFATLLVYLFVEPLGGQGKTDLAAIATVSPLFILFLIPTLRLVWRRLDAAAADRELSVQG